MANRNLLLCSYHFPPHGGSGVQRALKLAKYLPLTGWQAQALTAGHQHYPVQDLTLCDEIAEPASIHRALGLEPGAIAHRIARCMGETHIDEARTSSFEDRLYWRLDRWMNLLPLPELETLWLPGAIRQALHIIREHAIEAIVTTSPPCATHLIGRWLHHRLGIPWIADLRDPILDNFGYKPSPFSDKYYRWIEKTVVRQADRVVVTCPELAERLRRRYPDVAADRFVTVTNGYDPADAPAQFQPTNPTRFALTHVGAFYRDQTIRPILDAIRRLRARRADLRDQLNLRLVGTLSSGEKSLFRPEDATYLTYAGYCDHRRAVAEMAAADVLLLTTPAPDGGRLCIPAKTFEYLSFGRHIAAFLHSDTQIARIVRQAGNCTLLTEPNAAAWARAIESCFDAWKACRLQQPRDFSAVESFRRDRLAVRYAGVVDDALSAHEAQSLIARESAA